MAVAVVERWKAIKGFTGYEVSTLGRVRSFWVRDGGTKAAARVDRDAEPRVLKATDDGGRLLIVLPGDDGKKHTLVVAKLVLTAFSHRKPQPGQIVTYRDDDPRNCALTNLLWGGRSEVKRKAPRIDEMPQATKDQIAAAVRGGMRKSDAARKWGIHRATLNTLLAKHVPAPAAA